MPVFELAVTAEQAGKRADVLIAHASGLSRSLVTQAAREGRMLVNGLAVKGSYLVAQDDALRCEVHERHALSAQPEAIDLCIVYEDDDLLVVDKVAGMVTHPAHGSTSGTLVNALLAHVRSLPGDALRPGLVHRLDRDTSGLLAVAKTQAALSTLGIAMKDRRIRREYVGLVRGIPQHVQGTIEGAIGRDPHNRLKFAILSDGKPAVTHYQVREPLQNAAELLFRLETGRTHQIRVHLAALGHPLIGDPIYGRTDPRFELPGQALHAWRLALRHPRTGEEMEFESDPPPEYAAAKALLRVRPSR